MAIIAALTFRDYGLGWDDYTHSQYGDLLLKLYGSGFTDTRALSFVNLYKYGGGFDLAAALAAKVLPFGLFETRRLVGALIGIVGLFVTWRLGRRLGGPVAGWPRSFCWRRARFTTATCSSMRRMRPSPPRWRYCCSASCARSTNIRGHACAPSRSLGVGLGLAFGSRILAGDRRALRARARCSLIVIAEVQRAGGAKPARAALVQFVWIMLPALALGYLIMGLLWPWSVVSPLNPLHAAEYFDKFFEKPWRRTIRGPADPVPDMPVSYLPHLFALKLPEIMLALGARRALPASLVACCAAGVPLNRRAGLLVVALAVLLPIVVAMRDAAGAL